ncbi:MAG: radical SAM protein [Synergistaceae bacterium]|nr:radical SAM protein [Synergistaceae bacterium]
MGNLIRKTLYLVRERGARHAFVRVKKYLTYRLKKYFYSKFKFGRLPPVESFYFETHLVNHCNLDCWGCNHFSPLSDEWYADPNTFAKDLERLSELFDKDAASISLLGGEPLLHPELERFFPIARKAFPSAAIRIVTNGILLRKKDEMFWRECAAQNIDIAVTVYPDMEKQFEAAQDKGRSFGVKVYPFNSLETAKTSLHYPLDLSGGQSPSSNFVKCRQAIAISLREGRLYPCCIRPHLHIFNKYFPAYALPDSEKDSIDIYAAKSVAEILDFLSRPIPFCRFCRIDKRSDSNMWQQSKKDIEEWSL